MAFEELKQRQSVMWGSGPYQRVTETIADIELLRSPAQSPLPCAAKPSTSAPASVSIHK
jgi:hypothetical protein